MPTFSLLSFNPLDPPNVEVEQSSNCLSKSKTSISRSNKKRKILFFASYEKKKNPSILMLLCTKVSGLQLEVSFGRYKFQIEVQKKGLQRTPERCLRRKPFELQGFLK